MTDDDKLYRLAGLTGESDTRLLSAYLSLAADAIMQRSYPLEADRSGIAFPARYDGLQVRIALEMWARRGAEGESAHNENGVQRTYEDGERLLSEVVPHARAIGGGQ